MADKNRITPVIETGTDGTKPAVMVSWDRPMLERMKKEYARHKDTPKAVFVFDGNEYVVGYAKYLIEFLEGRLPP